MEKTNKVVFQDSTSKKHQYLPKLMMVLCTIALIGGSLVLMKNLLLSPYMIDCVDDEEKKKGKEMCTY